MSRRQSRQGQLVHVLRLTGALLLVLVAAHAGAREPAAASRTETVSAAQFRHLIAQTDRFDNLLLAADTGSEQPQKSNRTTRRWFSFNRLKRVVRRIDRKVTRAVSGTGRAVGRATGWVISQPVSWVDRPAGKRVRETGQQVLGQLGAKGAQVVFARTPAGMKLTRWTNQLNRAIQTAENAETMVKQAPAMLEKMARQEFTRRVGEARQRLENSVAKRQERLIKKYEPKFNTLKTRYEDLRKKGKELEERARWVTDPAAKLQMEAERKAVEYREKLYKKASERYQALRNKGEVLRGRLEERFQRRVQPLKDAYDKVVDKIEQTKQKVEEKARKVEDKLEKAEQKAERLKQKVRDIISEFPTTPPTVPGDPTMGGDDDGKVDWKAKREAEAEVAEDKAVADAVSKALEKRRQAVLQEKQKMKADEDARRKEEERLEAEKKRQAALEEARRKREEEEEAKRSRAVCEEYDPTNPACEAGAGRPADRGYLDKALAKRKEFQEASPDKLAKAGKGGQTPEARGDMADAEAEVPGKGKRLEGDDEGIQVAKRDKFADEFGAPVLPSGKPPKGPGTDTTKTATTETKTTTTTSRPTTAKTQPAQPAPTAPPEPRPVSNFTGTWHSSVVCAEADAKGDYGFSWKVVLTQTGDTVKGTIYFHNCPCGGRASYSLSGTATSDKTVSLKGVLDPFTVRGPLADYVPAQTNFKIVKNGTPSPNYGPGRTSACED